MVEGIVSMPMWPGERGRAATPRLEEEEEEEEEETTTKMPKGRNDPDSRAWNEKVKWFKKEKQNSLSTLAV